MRIRRRPLLLSLSSYYSSSSSSSSSSSLSSDPCLQKPAKEEIATDGEERRKLHPDGDLLSNHKSNPTEAIMEEEEKIQVLEETLDSQVTADKSAMVSLEWCNGEEEKGKKRKSSPVLMEGSRCSRVNGRGWRCSQETLVGYSLCEHHLGKGRIRSMNATIRGGRSRSNATGKHKKGNSGDYRDDDVNKSALALSAPKQEEEEEIDNIHGKINKKKMGLVKARSISSLLDETDHLAAATLSSLATAAMNI